VRRCCSVKCGGGGGCVMCCRYAMILAFDVDVVPDAERLAKEVNVKVMLVVVVVVVVVMIFVMTMTITIYVDVPCADLASHCCALQATSPALHHAQTTVFPHRFLPPKSSITCSTRSPSTWRRRSSGRSRLITRPPAPAAPPPHAPCPGGPGALRVPRRVHHAAKVQR